MIQKLIDRYLRWSAKQKALNAPPKLVAVYETTVHWRDINVRETITFYLKVDGGGRRSYNFHQYGYCDIYNIRKKYEGAVLTWVYGGDFPPGSKLVKPATGVKLTTIK